MKWNSSTSDSFKASNGVKQGGILSPILYCVYTDDLLLELQKSGVGCYIGPYFYGAFAYADDIILLCPSLKGTQEMLDICEKYAAQHNILFNAKKSQLLVVNGAKCHENLVSQNTLKLNGAEIPTVDEAKHLGHLLSNRVSQADGFIDVSYITSCFYKSVNILMATFGNVSSSVLCKLFVQYCSSLYGIVLCNLSSSSVQKLCVAWRKSVRRICRLPYRTHSNILPLLLGTAPLEISLKSRILKFFNSLLHSKSRKVSYIAELCRTQCISNMGSNVSSLLNEASIEAEKLCASGLISCWNETVSNEERAIACVCRELMDNRDDISTIRPTLMTSNECKDLLNSICCD